MTAEADRAIAEIPGSCACYWELDELTHHWRRTIPREHCPWHLWDTTGARPQATVHNLPGQAIKGGSPWDQRVIPLHRQRGA